MKNQIHKHLTVFLTADGLAESIVRVDLQQATVEEAPEAAIEKMASLDGAECGYTVLAVYGSYAPMEPLDRGAQLQSA